MHWPHREQAHSYSLIGCVQVEIGRLSGCLREQAQLLRRSKAERAVLLTTQGRVSARLLLILISEPVGRLSGGIDPGWERSDRLAQPNTSRGGAAKQTGGDEPRINPAAKEPEP